VTPLTEIEADPWPDFITGIEVEVRWDTLPVVGTLRVRCLVSAAFSLAVENVEDELIPFVVGTLSAEGACAVSLDEAQISSLLVRRRVVVRWGTPIRQTFFPINIASDSKPGLPAVLGQHPTEQDLLAYFHGRIDEEDLMNLLIERSRPQETCNRTALAPPGRELQNYVVREFLEGLYGMEDMLHNSAATPRGFEQALLGEFSPVRLANETQRAFAAGRRTPTATAFQLVELLRLIENLTPRDEKKPKAIWFAGTRERSMEQLLRVVRAASTRNEFRESCKATSFQELVNSVLKPNTAARWWAAIELR
jgi:hypothetical protein